jgi:hypothetical protein
MVNSAHFTLVSCRRAGHGSRVPARRLALAGIRPAIEARTGDGGRCVRSALASWPTRKPCPPMEYPKAKIRPNEDGKVYNFVRPGRKPDNPGYLKSEAVAYPSELAP